MIDLSVVVLPAPLRPSSVTTSPSCTSNVTPCKMCDSPYQACKSLIASRGVRTSSMPHPHVSLANLGIARHHLVVAFRQHTAARQHRDVIRQIRDDRKVMLDHQNGTVGRHALDQLGHPINVLVTHACG